MFEVPERGPDRLLFGDGRIGWVLDRLGSLFASEGGAFLFDMGTGLVTVVPDATSDRADGL